MLTQSMPALDSRHHQAFPVLLESEVYRVREFGSVREFKDGDTLQKIGDIGRGLAIVLSGEAAKPAPRQGSKIILAFRLGSAARP